MTQAYVIPDSLAAVRQYLLADTIVTGLAQTRIFGGSLPRAEVASMPRSVAVLTPAGGIGEGAAGYAPLMAQRLDIKSYGSNEDQAWSLHLAVRGALKALSRDVFAGTLLHSVTVEASGSLTYDEDGKWPMVLGVYSILSAEVPVSV